MSLRHDHRRHCLTAQQYNGGELLLVVDITACRCARVHGHGRFCRCLRAITRGVVRIRAYAGANLCSPGLTPKYASLKV